jgi:hypothetical protein
MDAVIGFAGEDILCQASGSAVEELRIDGGLALARLTDWAKRYDTAVEGNQDGALFSIGQDRSRSSFEKRGSGLRTARIMAAAAGDVSWERRG